MLGGLRHTYMYWGLTAYIMFFPLRDGWWQMQDELEADEKANRLARREALRPKLLASNCQACHRSQVSGSQWRMTASVL
jgi:hypothetical protein